MEDGEGFVMRMLRRLSGVMAAIIAMLLMVGSASAATMNGYDVSLGTLLGAVLGVSSALAKQQ